MEDAAWIDPPDLPEAPTIASELGIPLSIARVLAKRGFSDAAAARCFLHGNTADFNDPFLFSGMAAAVERIRGAIAAKEKILIFGDYDVDGILSMVMLHSVLTDLGGDVDQFIPDRLTDGYGIKDDHVAVAVARGAKLVISVDCGIKAAGFVRRARQAGVDVIITDHHMPGADLPPATAVLDAWADGAGYPDKNLAGVGVVYKIIQALLENTPKAKKLPSYLKLVAIGTISDLAPLRGENRIFVRQGLDALNKAVFNPGLRSLLDVSGLLGRTITEGDVGFRIGPRINAAGRMGETDQAVRLFFATTEGETDRIAQRLDALNSQRQKAEEKIRIQASERIRERRHHEKYKILILGSEEWNRGLIGIVASRLKDEFRLPVILFAYENGRAVGSGRSLAPFSLIDCLEGLDRGGVPFVSYGGHKYAVGCTLARGDLAAFRTEANAAAAAVLTDEVLRPKIEPDAALAFSEIAAPGFMKAYDLLRPFGVGNPKPLFFTAGAEVASAPRVLKGKHLKLLLKHDGRVFEALAWDRAAWADGLAAGDTIKAAYSLQTSTYLGEEKLQLVLEGFRR